MSDIIFLKGKRAILRPLLVEDVPLLHRWVNDPEVNRFIRIDTPMTLVEEMEFFQGLHKRKPNDIIFMIVVDGKPIGTMGIHQIDWKSRTATTGAMIEIGRAHV